MKKSFYKPRIPNLDELKSLIEIIGYLYHDEQEHFEERNGNNQDHIFNHLITIKMYLIDIGIVRREENYKEGYNRVGKGFWRCELVK